MKNFTIKLFQKILEKFGLELKTMSRPISVSENDIQVVLSKISGFTMLSRTRIVSLADQIAYCNSAEIKGCFVECGVWKGGAVALFGHISRLTGRDNRDLHLFDAFQDICAPNPEVDGEKALKESQKFGQYVDGKQTPLIGIYNSFGGHGTVEACRDVIIERIGYPAKHVHFHVGWFQDTVFAAARKIGDIALLRLDGDWYESTKVCLDALYDNVVPGGIVIFDDYLTYEGCKKAVDEFFESRRIAPLLIRVDTSCYFIVKN